MLKRLGIGLLKGLVLGAAAGAALHFGLGLGSVSVLAGFAIAMLTGAAAAVISGRPPWQKGAWIESLLKGGAGLAAGALVYFLAWKFASFGLPFALGGVPAGTQWTQVPILLAPTIAALFGGLVELDNTGEDGAKPGDKSAKVRVASDDVVEEEVPADGGEARRDRKKA